jgi:hypothetical protein
VISLTHKCKPRGISLAICPPTMVMTELKNPSTAFLSSSTLSPRLI